MSRFSTRVLGLLRDAREKGFREGTRHVCHRIYEDYHENRLGIRTSGVLSPTELGFCDPDLTEYAPVTYRNFQRAMANVTIDPGRDVFLDYGCGMGRAIVLAATYPFRQVIGVELSPSLVEIARENVRRAAKRLSCLDIKIEACDATRYPIDDRTTVIFMNNPFRGSVLTQVVRNIEESLESNPRQLSIVFGNFGAFDAQFDGASWLTKRSELQLYPKVGYAIYDCHPPKKGPEAATC